MSMGLARRFPKLRFVVQDLQSMIGQAETVWRHELPEALETHRTELKVHDIFTPQPVKGADVYWLRLILFVTISYSSLSICSSFLSPPRV